MIAELDVYRAANILVKEYGAEEARLMAAKKAKPMIEHGDIDGLRTWKAILRAVLELRSKRGGPGERVIENIRALPVRFDVPSYAR